MSEKDQIRMCLNCPKSKCDDCLSRGGKRKHGSHDRNELIQIASMYSSGIPVWKIEQELSISHGSIYMLIRKGLREIAASRGV